MRTWHLAIPSRKLILRERDPWKAKLDSVHKLLRKQACLVEDADAVDTKGKAEVEEDVNFIGGTEFQRSGN